MTSISSGNFGPGSTGQLQVIVGDLLAEFVHILTHIDSLESRKTCNWEQDRRDWVCGCVICISTDVDLSEMLCIQLRKVHIVQLVVVCIGSLITELNRSQFRKGGAEANNRKFIIVGA